MKITHLDLKPIAEFPFLNAGRRANDFYVDRVPVYKAFVDGMPNSVDAMIATADLQGLEPMSTSPDTPLRLLGEVLPEQLGDVLADLGVNTCNRVAAFLAGDFYTYPDLHGRGGTGDVTSVWNAFADQFQWVFGVAGNHDMFGSKTSRKPNWNGPQVHFLDGDRVELNGLQIAGLSGVIGNPRKNFRRNHNEFLELLELILHQRTDIAIMHEGPDANTKDCRGMVEIRQVLEQAKPSLVIRGHKHWPVPFAELSGGIQVLNVEATVVIMLPHGS